MVFQESLHFLILPLEISLPRGYKILVDFIGGFGKLNLHIHSAFDCVYEFAY